MVPPLLPSSFPVEGTSRDKDFLPSSSSSVEGNSRDTSFLSQFSPPVEGTSRDVRDQGLPESSGVSSDHVSTEIGSPRAGETGPVDACSTFEEAHWLCSVDFDKLKSKLLRYETRLWKTLDEEKSLRCFCEKRAKELIHLRYEMNRSLNYEGRLERQLQSKTEDLECLWGEVGHVKYEYNKLKVQIDAHITSKKNALAMASALVVQLRNTRKNSFVQTSKIENIESDLLKMKTEVVDTWEEDEEIRAKADKKVAIYLKDVADARAELRGDSDWVRRSNEYARCRPRSETLEQIHARGFDLSEEIEQTKVDEYDAKILVSDAEDNEEGAERAAVPEEKACDGLRSELLRQKARLQKVLDEGESLRLLSTEMEVELLCRKRREALEYLKGDIDRVGNACSELRAQVQAQALEETDALTKGSPITALMASACASMEESAGTEGDLPFIALSAMLKPLRTRERQLLSIWSRVLEQHRSPHDHMNDVLRFSRSVPPARLSFLSGWGFSSFLLVFLVYTSVSVGAYIDVLGVA
ncbi:uncharacterized protein [Nicotiana sylvestris]|uniref:uncharacterized protein n=1 Tax=Nicotiana sylvestris TaxID=4096 RepID=UPI00388C5E52